MTPSTCEEIGTELVAFLDGELDEGERRPIASHVSSCLVCRREIERLSAVRNLLADLPRIEPGPEFASRFWERLDVVPESTLRRRSRRSMYWALPALAAAAVLAIATSEPPLPRSTKCLAAARKVKNTPSRLTRMTRRHSSKLS